jgi:Universal stress protein family.
VEKGSVNERMKEAAGEVDLVMMGVSGVSHLKTRKLGSTAMAMIEESGKPVMLLQEGLDLSGDIVAVYDGTLDGLTAVEMGARVAKRHGGTFFVIHFGEVHERELRGEDG